MEHKIVDALEAMLMEYRDQPSPALRYAQEVMNDYYDSLIIDENIFNEGQEYVGPEDC